MEQALRSPAEASHSRSSEEVQWPLDGVPVRKRLKADSPISARQELDQELEQQAVQALRGSSTDSHASQQSNQSSHKRGPANQEEPWFPVLALSAAMAPAVTKQLQTTTSTQSLQTWEQHETNQTIYSVRLIGDAQHPDQFVSISAHDLMCHSQWGSEQLQQASIKSGSLSLVLPVRTHPAIVRKLVQSLYSGCLTLPDAVEELLMVAKRLKVSLVATACTEYLTGLDLPPEQLEQLIWLFQSLEDRPALKKSLLRLTKHPWVSGTPAIIACVFKDMLKPNGHGIELCQEILQDLPSGALCYLQVFDVLMAAGVALDDPILPSLFHVAYLSHRNYHRFQQRLTGEGSEGSDRTSYEMLLDILKRASGCSRWPTPRKVQETSCACTEQSEHNCYRASGQYLRLKSLASRQSPGDPEYRVTMLDGSGLGRLIQQLVIYTIRPECPFVQILINQQIAFHEAHFVIPAGSEATSKLQDTLSRRTTCSVGMWTRARQQKG